MFCEDLYHSLPNRACEPTGFFADELDCVQAVDDWGRYQLGYIASNGLYLIVAALASGHF